MTNAAGAVTDTYEYDAFGNALQTSGSTPNNYLYRGEQYDPDLGLYYLRARYYNPATGRFMSRDPNVGTLTDPKSLHKYLYAGGDPTNRLDPSGRASLIGYAIGVELPSMVVYGLWIESGACGAMALLEDLGHGQEAAIGKVGVQIEHYFCDVVWALSLVWTPIPSPAD